MSIRHALLVLAMLTPACAEDVRAQTAFTVKYGNGDGQLGRDTNPETAREYAGPSSIRLGADGEILVCDPLNHRVHRLTPNGQPKEVVTLPAATKGDAEIVAVDAAVDRGGTLYVLELATQSVMRWAQGKPLDAWAVPANAEGGTILNALAIDPQRQDVLVFDGAKDRVVRFDAKGQATAMAPGAVSGLSMDGSGQFVSLELPDGGSASKLALVRVDATGKKAAPLAVTLAEPVNEAHLLGLDQAGRAYIEVTFGAIEKPDRRQVLVVSAEGKIVEGIAVPPPPDKFHMVSARVVLPDGGFLTATDTAQGLEIRRHGLAR